MPVMAARFPPRSSWGPSSGSGARAVFGREGYTCASIDAIAAEAGVSSRTTQLALQNHLLEVGRKGLLAVDEGNVEELVREGVELFLLVYGNEPG
ncbi:TetR family transcriptional regulator [Streptomyces sp. NBC_01304]|uniref:TetR family transcriptional regulator n=1 Tax=Streptomyces sp. NBC_01304 TaxID=2903818 RepID=UPI003FA39711